MTDIQYTKSIDSFTIEVYDLNGVDYVDVSHCRIGGQKPAMTFIKGDSAAAARFLTQLAELLGVGLITIAEK